MEVGTENQEVEHMTLTFDIKPSPPLVWDALCIISGKISSRTCLYDGNLDSLQRLNKGRRIQMLSRTENASVVKICVLRNYHILE